ncbi:endoprotease aex-5-like [Mya arenaria]|uniref:endoprotease aex-5-like n=1 Tax=Mya arenaria TaxID=6604 RepID=UPI0022E43B81|nr:endoprotease aex-5-like [Mya arenaria]
MADMDYKCTCLIIILNLLCIVRACIDYDLDIIFTDKISVVCDERDIEAVVEDLSRRNITFLYKEANNVFAFKLQQDYTHELNEDEIAAIYKSYQGDSNKNKISKIQFVQQGEDHFAKQDFIPVENHEQGIEHATRRKRDEEKDSSGLVCSPFYDKAHGIEQAWIDGFTGKDVVIAVLDVGVDMEHPELKQNIAKSISKSFVMETDDPGATIHGYYPEARKVSNHGNACASVAAGVRTNATCDLCSIGVAFDAKIAVLKVGTVVDGRERFYPSIETPAYAAALGYRNDVIQIYLCGWDFERPFTKLDIGAEKAIEEGYTYGRNGHGTFYIVPSSRPGNAFANSPYTITVNSFGINGSLPGRRYINSATLVSAFGDGKTRNASGMCTATHIELAVGGMFCSHEFRGPSSAVSIIAGIIALVLQNRPTLSVREVKHLLVDSAGHEGLAETSNFVKNGAGKAYHPAFGFGYPNVPKMIDLSGGISKLAPLVTNLACREGDRKERDKSVVEFFEWCDLEIEQVMVEVGMQLPKEENVVLVLISPFGTNATLMDTVLNTIPGESDRVELRHIQTRFLANAFWGESSYGNWRLELYVRNQKLYSPIDLKNLKLHIHGTQPDKDLIQNCSPVCNQHTPTISKEEEKKPISLTNTQSKPIVLVVALVIVMIIVIILLYFFARI